MIHGAVQNDILLIKLEVGYMKTVNCPWTNKKTLKFCYRCLLPRQIASPPEMQQNIFYSILKSCIYLFDSFFHGLGILLLQGLSDNESRMCNLFTYRSILFKLVFSLLDFLNTRCWV